MHDADPARSELLAGAKAGPMLVGIIPFGLVAGPPRHHRARRRSRSAVDNRVEAITAGGRRAGRRKRRSSPSSRLHHQPASAPVLGRSPPPGAVPCGGGSWPGYFLTDQAYAVAITRWTEDDAEAAGGPPHWVRPVPSTSALPLLWATAGVHDHRVLIGRGADSLPLDFAVRSSSSCCWSPPSDRPAAVAASWGRRRPVRAGGRGAPRVLFGALRHRGGGLRRGHETGWAAVSPAQGQPMSRIWVAIILSGTAPTDAGVVPGVRRSPRRRAAERAATAPQIPPAALASSSSPPSSALEACFDLWQPRFLAFVVAAWSRGRRATSRSRSSSASARDADRQSRGPYVPGHER
jgi:hypothetical protein